MRVESSGRDTSAYSSSGGLHGIGLKTTNAFSEFLQVEIRRYGLVFRQRFEDGGIPVTPVNIYDATGSIVGEINESTNLVLDRREIATALDVGGKKVKITPEPKQAAALPSASARTGLVLERYGMAYA